MDRRAFIKSLACICAGAAALPQQIETFERLFEANAPMSNELIAIDRFVIGGLATQSMPARVIIKRGDRELMRWGMNLFGGMLHWTAVPDQKIIVVPGTLHWEITSPAMTLPSEWIEGSISYLDNQLVRCSAPLIAATGSL